MSGPTFDVQTYDYVTDNGKRIVAMYEAVGEVETERDIDVTFMVDGMCQLKSSTHFKCPAGVPIGEHLLHAVLRCLHDHLRPIALGLDAERKLRAKMGIDDDVDVEVHIARMVGGEVVEVAPHLRELTKEQETFWLENPDVFQHLYNESFPSARKAVEKWPQLADDEGRMEQEG